MSAGKLDIYIEQGATFTRKLIFREPPVSPATVGDPIDLTGQTFAGKIKKNVMDAVAVVDFTCTVLDQNTNPGEMTFELSAAQTSAIVLKSQKGSVRVTEDFAYDLERTFPSGKKERVIEGVASVSPEVTK